MNSYLAKPIESDKLIEILDKYLKKSFFKKINENTIKNKKNNENIDKIDLNIVSKSLGLSTAIAQKVIDKFKVDIIKELDEFEQIIEHENKEAIVKKSTLY